MALPIIERPLYNLITLETAAWSTPFTWVDRTSSIVNSVSYSEGGRVSDPGQTQVDVGTLTATFKNLATAPLVGDLVRLRRAGTTEYAFTGYVENVSQRVVFDSTVSASTPVVLTTIYCADWVGYVSQFQLEGIGGALPSTGAIVTSSVYEWEGRIAAIHKAIDATYATKIIGYTYTAGNQTMGDTDMVGTISDHLDLITYTDSVYWYGAHVLPTNKTTGRTGLVHLRDFSTAPSSGKTFTDVVGTAGQLHYVEIDLESSSANVANNIVANNRTRVNISDRNVTRIGGFNEQDFMVIAGVNTLGVPFDSTWKGSDATSITTYGNRQSEIFTNGGSQGTFYNYVPNPSAEYSDDGYPSGANTKVRRRRPANEATPFTAYDGEWAIRLRRQTANATAVIDYVGGESDGIPVTAGQTLYGSAQALRGTPSRTDVRAQLLLRWYDDSETLLSTTTGANVALTTANTWYQVTASAVVPVNAVRVTMTISYDRSGGGNHSIGDFLWCDALMLSRFNSTYYDGDTAWTSTYFYLWTGGVGASPSLRIGNYLDDIIARTLTKYSTTSNRVTRIRWNAQEDLASVSAMYVGSKISIVYKGTTTTHRIVGIDGNIDSERYMIDYYLEKV